MHFGFMNVMLVLNNNWHVLVNHVATFRVARARVQIYLGCVGITPQLKMM